MSIDFHNIAEHNYPISKEHIDLGKLSPHPAIIFGAFNSNFAAQQASFFHRKGIDVIIITQQKGLTGKLSDQTTVLSIDDYVPVAVKAFRWLLYMLGYVIDRIRNLVFSNSRSRTHDWDQRTFRRLLNRMVEALIVSWIVDRIEPLFVLGQQIDRYGLATASCRNYPRILMPFGQDIYKTQQRTWRWLILMYALKHVELVLPASMAASDYLDSILHAPNKPVIKPISWGVDLKAFCRASEQDRVRICRQYQIDPASLIMLNVRRFVPDWGSKDVLKVFLELAQKKKDLHFVLIGNIRKGDTIVDAISLINARSLQGRFTIFEEFVPLDVLSDLMSISDYFTSFMIDKDMRSLSILQATACGSLPILNTQDEYLRMQAMGFEALFVDPKNTIETVNSILALIDDDTTQEYMRAKNREYMSKHEDEEIQIDIMFNEIMNICNK